MSRKNVKNKLEELSEKHRFVYSGQLEQFIVELLRQERESMGKELMMRADDADCSETKETVNRWIKDYLKKMNKIFNCN